MLYFNCKIKRRQRGGEKLWDKITSKAFKNKNMVIEKGVIKMKVVGMNYSVKANGKVTTLYVEQDFEPFYKDEDGTKGFVGKRAESIYAGYYDCSKFKVGDEIEIYYDKAMTLKSGKTFQTIKKIEKLN